MKNQKSFLDKVYQVSDNLEKTSKELEIAILKDRLRRQIEDRVYGRTPMTAWKFATGVLNVAGGAVGMGTVGASFAMLYVPQHSLTAVISGAVIGALIIPKERNFNSSLLADCQRLGHDVFKKARLSAVHCGSKLTRAWAENMDPTAAYNDATGKMIIPPKSRYLAENTLPPMKVINP